MTFPVLGANSAVGTYSIDNSVRLNDNDSAGFSRTNQSSPTDAKIFTWSGWVKRGNIDTSSALFAGNSGSNYSNLYFRGSGSQNYIRLVETSDTFSTYDTLIDTQMLFRDVSAYYHILLKYDSTNATANDRAIIYVNGVQVDLTISNSVNSNYTSPLNEGSYSNYVGRASGGNYMDGYMAEVHFIDGQALSPTDFGEFDEDSGIWKPISYSGTYGTNGFYLDFENSGSLGADQSGNGNDFTPTNLASTDQTTDTPTNNFATINALQKTSGSQLLSEGNLEHRTTGNWMYLPATMGASSGKWYAEIKLIDPSNFNVGVMQLGGASDTTSLMNTNNTILGSNSAGDAWALYGNGANTGTYKNNSTPNYGNIATSFPSNIVANDIIMIAMDTDNQKIWFGVNGSWDNSGDPVAGTNPMPVNTSMIAGKTFTFASGPEQGTQQWNFGNPPFSISSGNSDGNGYGNFEYAPPSGYLALCTQNLATELSPTIDDGSQYFQPITYSGNGGNQDISANFDIDLAWIKSRTNAYNHTLIDTLRGNSNRLYSNATDAESTLASPNEINLDGSTLDLNGGVSIYNASGNNYITWLWNAGGTGVSNTDGSITSLVSANTTAGFSIVTYTGTGSAGTVGHGLGSTVAMVITKSRDSASAWQIYHKDLGKDETIQLNETTSAGTITNYWGTSTPNSTVFGVIGGGYNNNLSGESTIAYCFSEKIGYSKFGSYTGNGSTDGTFIYTGFRPAWVMIKVTDTTEDWWILDTTRDTFNSARRMLYADGSSAELNVSEEIDFLSNGFKLRRSTTGRNGSGNSYIYMAFAESPFVTSSGIPVVAR